MLCAVIAKKNFDEILNLAEKIKNFKDVEAVELRLDFLSENLNEEELLNLSKILENKIKIATLMPEWEGGNFKGSEEERLNLLRYYSNYCDCITIELKAIKENFNLCEKILNSPKNLIVSVHNFERCYEENEIAEIMKDVENLREKYGKKTRKIITKIASKINLFEDNYKILKFLMNKENYKNCILLGTGKRGKITRLLNYYFGFLTYISIEEKTDEGQLCLGEFRKILKILDQNYMLEKF